MHAGITSTDSANLAQLAGNQYAYVVSGCVWTADAPASTLNGSMTAGTVMIKGILLTVAAVTAHAFTASNDTYIDLADNGDGTATITYTGVANGTTSPALASSGTTYTTCRIAVVVSNASNITSTAASINQGNTTFNYPGSGLFSRTVSSGSNGNAISTATLDLDANTAVPGGGGWAQVAHSGGQTYTIAFTGVTGSGTSTQLTGVTVISGTTTLLVSTGDTVKGIVPLTGTDMLGNVIYPTRPVPTMIGNGYMVGAYTNGFSSLNATAVPSAWTSPGPIHRYRRLDPLRRSPLHPQPQIERRRRFDEQSMARLHRRPSASAA